MKKIYSLALICSLSVGLAACGASQQPSTKVAIQNQIKWPVSAEKLLQADGFLSFAGLKTTKQVPLQRHASARGRVNPARTTGHFPYTDYLRREDMLAKSNFRQLSLQDDGQGQGFEVAALNVISGASSIPAPLDKPSVDAFALRVAAADQADDSVAEAAPATSTIRNTAMQVAALIDRKLDEVLSGNKKTNDVQVNEDIAPQASFTDDQHASLSVVNMRMGDYEDKTRLVLDLSAAASFDYDLNNVDSVLTVHIDGAEWDLDTQRYFDDHPLVQSYEVSKSIDSDVTLEISLKHPSKMIMSGFVRPDDSRGHRIFFDVAAL